MLSESNLDAFGYYDRDYDDYQKSNDLLSHYQQWVETMMLTSGEKRLIENSLGLVGESGEVAEKIKKYFRDGYTDVSAVKKELGDVFFYLIALCSYFKLDANDVVLENQEKLNSRKLRGVLQGSGDTR